MKALCGDKIDIYSGNDDQIIPIMSLGGLGVISVAANIVPKVIYNITSEFLSGNYNNALKLQLDYLELCNVLFIETNPIPIKTALNLLSKNVGNLRLPLYEMDNKNKDKLIKTLEIYNLI
jgi:4-hydroxy-tetrahydrodipicolinate synthase